MVLNQQCATIELREAACPPRPSPPTQHQCKQARNQHSRVKQTDNKCNWLAALRTEGSTSMPWTLFISMSSCFLRMQRPKHACCTAPRASPMPVLPLRLTQSPIPEHAKSRPHRGTVRTVREVPGAKPLKAHGLKQRSRFQNEARELFGLGDLGVENGDSHPSLPHLAFAAHRGPSRPFGRLREPQRRRIPSAHKDALRISKLSRRTVP